LVLDDFGTGASELKFILDQCLSAIKLDRTLIARIGESDPERLLRALIGIARTFELDVLAEGVERPEQVHFLVSHHCLKVQGFLFGRPTRKRDLAAVIAKDLRNASQQAPADETAAA
jgi:EAL domain-containing protein (putative c-di-GMP-specific phosphodiesterase class I)